MKYSAYQLVKIKENLKVGEIYGRTFAYEGMQKFFGKECKIVGIQDSSMLGIKVQLDIDKMKFDWSIEMLDPIIIEKVIVNESGKKTKENRYAFDQPQGAAIEDKILVENNNEKRD